MQNRLHILLISIMLSALLLIGSACSGASIIRGAAGAAKAGAKGAASAGRKVGSSAGSKARAGAAASEGADDIYGSAPKQSPKRDTQVGESGKDVVKESGEFVLDEAVDKALGSDDENDKKRKGSR